MPNPYARDTSITANNSTNPAILGANKQLTGNQTKPIQNNRINTSITNETNTKQDIVSINVNAASNPSLKTKVVESFDRTASQPSRICH